jgi:hypothetical protein
MLAEGSSKGARCSAFLDAVAEPDAIIFSVREAPHAVLAGQYALEQIFYLDIASMVDPTRSSSRRSTDDGAIIGQPRGVSSEERSDLRRETASHLGETGSQSHG